MFVRARTGGRSRTQKMMQPRLTYPPAISLVAWNDVSANLRCMPFLWFPIIRCTKEMMQPCLIYPQTLSLVARSGTAEEMMQPRLIPLNAISLVARNDGRAQDGFEHRMVLGAPLKRCSALSIPPACHLFGRAE